ncbi:magnesium transporter CorA family protein [Antrihabitans stalactiti]|uniref:Magnesium transporter CorA family protein n=1 Tax=Antrihabitans stalactiti TaxID=2584121 RepID=A0A848KBU8_9NOCA|nr:magnesium transporter CorA family protein [Antrihabitans stalactiti]NMN94654.1 magnesium transporter CorA family protein [Antrihabitans stalactiti]
MDAQSSVRGQVWRSGTRQDEFEFDKISDYLQQEDVLVWVDLYEPDHEVLTRLADELGLNVWAVEDAVADAERVKASSYSTHTFFTVYAVQIDQDATTETDSGMLSTHRISAFVLPRALITVRLSPYFDFDTVTARWADLDSLQHGVGALVHGLLDVVVDGHFDAVQALDDGIEALEDDLFDTTTGHGLQRRTFRLRKDLVEFRRVVLPVREVVNTIQHRRRDGDIAPELDPLFADLYDHVLRVSEWTEALRDMITAVFETNLSLQDMRLNTVMKKLTGWAAIIAVPTAVTGFYGQNVPYPGFDQFSGFLASTTIIVLIVAALYVMFRRRDWL